MFIRESVDAPQVAVSLMKRTTSVGGVQGAQLPPFLSAGGLSIERQQYLFKEIRPHVSDDSQDKLCPRPPADDDLPVASVAAAACPDDDDVTMVD